MTETHLTEQDVVSYTTRKLPFSEQVDVALHLRSCSQCSELLTRLAPNYRKEVIKRVEASLRRSHVGEKAVRRSVLSFLDGLQIWISSWWLPASLGFTALLIGLTLIFSFYSNKLTVTDAQLQPSNNLNQEPHLTNRSTNVTTGTSSESESTPLSVTDSEGQIEESTEREVAVITPSSNLHAGPKISNELASRKRPSETRVKPHERTANNTKQKSVQSSLQNKQERHLVYSDTRSTEDSSLNSNVPCINTADYLSIDETPIDKTAEMQDDEGLTFRWKPIPNAVKYHLYLSDSDLNLIDEFETESETSYKTKSQLKPNVAYRWKMIATLKNGATLSLEPIRFTIGQKNKNQLRILKKQVNQTRCVPDQR